jgi:hypothetical protein
VFFSSVSKIRLPQAYLPGTAHQGDGTPEFKLKPRSNLESEITLIQRTVDGGRNGYYNSAAWGL